MLFVRTYFLGGFWLLLAGGFWLVVAFKKVTGCSKFFLGAFRKPKNVQGFSDEYVLKKTFNVHITLFLTFG